MIQKKTVRMMTMMKMMNQHFPKMTTIKALLYHTKTSQALLKTNGPFLGTGFYWIASLKWMNLLTKIQDLKHVLVLHYNAGKAIVTQKADLKGHRTVWYYPKGIANILSLTTQGSEETQSHL